MWDWIVDTITAAILFLVDWIKEIVFWIFDSLLELATGLLGALELGALGDYAPASLFAQLPPDVLNIIGLIRIPEAVAIIVSALVLRMTLQLIPFTRLGS